MSGSFSQVDPGRIQVRDGGGCLGLFGLPFFCAGIFVTLVAAGVIVRKEWGPLVPMHARTYRLDDYTAVTLGLERGDSDTSDQFPVSLKSRSGADLVLTSSTQCAEARARTADVARHLHFDINDATTDHPFSEGLADDEIRYLHSVVRRSLAR